MPKYWLWNTVLVTVLVTIPPSGSGVTESLALDQAPLTRMSASGDSAWRCVLLDESPPFGGILCSSVSWPQENDTDNDNNDMDPIRTTNKLKNREYILLLTGATKDYSGREGRSVARYLASF